MELAGLFGKKTTLADLLQRYNFSAQGDKKSRMLAVFQAVSEMVKEYGPQLTDDLYRDLKSIYRSENIYEPVTSLVKPVLKELEKNGIRSIRLDGAFEKFLNRRKVHIRNASKRSRILYIQDEEAKRFIEKMFKEEEIFVYKSVAHPEAEEEDIYDGWAI